MSKKGSGDGCGHGVGPKGGTGYMGLLSPMNDADEQVPRRASGLLGSISRSVRQLRHIGRASNV